MSAEKPKPIFNVTTHIQSLSAAFESGALQQVRAAGAKLIGDLRQHQLPEDAMTTQQVRKMLQLIKPQSPEETMGCHTSPDTYAHQIAAISIFGSKPAAMIVLDILAELDAPWASQQLDALSWILRTTDYPEVRAEAGKKFLQLGRADSKPEVVAILLGQLLQDWQTKKNPEIERIVAATLLQLSIDIKYYRPIAKVVMSGYEDLAAQARTFLASLEPKDAAAVYAEAFDEYSSDPARIASVQRAVFALAKKQPEQVLMAVIGRHPNLNKGAWAGTLLGILRENPSLSKAQPELCIRAAAAAVGESDNKDVQQEAAGALLKLLKDHPGKPEWSLRIRYLNIAMYCGNDADRIEAADLLLKATSDTKTLQAIINCGTPAQIDKALQTASGGLAIDVAVFRHAICVGAEGLKNKAYAVICKRDPQAAAQMLHDMTGDAAKRNAETFSWLCDQLLKLDAAHDAATTQALMEAMRYYPSQHANKVAETLMRHLARKPAQLIRIFSSLTQDTGDCGSPMKYTPTCVEALLSVAQDPNLPPEARAAWEVAMVGDMPYRHVTPAQENQRNAVLARWKQERRISPDTAQRRVLSELQATLAH